MYKLIPLIVAASLASTAHASVASLPPPLQTLELELVGQGEFRRFGFHIYDASYWRNDDDSRALKIVYQKNISSDRLISATVKSWKKIGAVPAAKQQQWADAIAAIWPDVSPGDALVAVVRSTHTDFIDGQGNRLGRIDDPDFGPRFLDVWLHPETKARRLRSDLISGGEPG